MEKSRKNKGITLIALVITIIVLLILAGVAIATLTGDNGILSQANKAKTQTEKAGEDEKLKLAIMGSYGLDGKLNLADLKRNLTEQGISYTDSSSFPLIATVNGESIEIKEDGKQEKLFNGAEWDKTATPEDCFYWKSNNSNEEGYDTIIGYTAKIENYTKLRFPSRCKKIEFSYDQYPDDIGWAYARALTNNILKVEIPETVTSIGMISFGDPNRGSFQKLEEIIIPDSVVSIGYGAFWNCINLNSITIPNSLTSIDMYTFAGCTNITDITIPNSIISMENNVFEQWTSSQTINIKGYSSAPSGWDYNWNAGCSAQINWNQ